MDKLVEFFKAIGCKNRIKIIKAIAERKMCLKRLTNTLDIDMSTISRHVKELVNAGILTEEKEGRRKLLTLTDERIMDILTLAEEIVKDSDNQ